MSYARVAGQNVPPYDKQPHPDPALLTTETPRYGVVADDAAKVNVVGPDWKENPKTLTSESRPLSAPYSSGAYPPTTHTSSSNHTANTSTSTNTSNKSHDRDLKDPSNKSRTDRAINSASASYDKLKSTAKKDIKNATNESYWLYGRLHEWVMRPGVAGGVVGVVNLTLLSTLGYLAYANWDTRYRWMGDRKVVSAVVLGLGVLGLGEGYIAEKWKQTRERERD